MPSFRKFKQDLRPIAKARSIRLQKGFLKYQRNVIRLTGAIEGMIYVRLSGYLHWRVTRSAIAGIRRRRDRGNSVPVAVVLLHETNRAGFVLPEEIALRDEDNWDFHASEGQYGLGIEDVKRGLRFESLEELVGILRALFS